MKRRQALSTIAIIIGGAIVSGEVIFSSCNDNLKTEEVFTDEIISLLNEIGEIIIPASQTSPGAKAAKIGEFIKIYVMDCYYKADRIVFFEGINKISNLSNKKYGKKFFKLNISQKKDLIKTLEMEGQEYDSIKLSKRISSVIGDKKQLGRAKIDPRNKKYGDPKHFFTMIKDLILFGYFTSEEGATKALRYVQTPGYYKGDVAYKNGDKSWAT